MAKERRSERGLAQELQSGHRALLVVLCAVLLASVLTTGYQLVVSQPQVSRYTELTRDSRLLHQAMLDQETSLRAWLATSDPIFLQPYRDGNKASEERIEHLVHHSTGTPRIIPDLVPLLLARDGWQQWARSAAAWKVGSNARINGELTRFLLKGKGLFELYREADTRSTAHIVERRDAAARDQTIAMLTGMAGIFVLLGGATVWAFWRRRQVQTTVLEPMSHMIATIRQLRAGDMSARAGPSGVSELDAVGSALGAFTDHLVQADVLAAARETRMALLAERLETVIGVARETSGSLNVRSVSETVAAAAASLLGVPTTLWIRNEAGHFHATRRSDDPHGTVPPSDLQPPALIAAVAADAHTSHDETWRAYPLVLAGMVIGVLQAAVTTEDDDSERVLEALLSTAAAALESARLHSSARDLAELDALTQLPNRRRLEGDLKAEWDRSRRYSRPLSFVMIDLDHFKQLNDTYGHLVGDTVLNAAATAIHAVLRTTDTAYRYGGEEIAVLLRETMLEEALSIAERVRRAIAGVTVPGSPATVTASLGVAQLSNSMLEQTDLVEQADKALYGSKKEGRDRVTAARLDTQLVRVAGNDRS